MPRNSNTPTPQNTQGRVDRDDDQSVQTRSQNDFGGGNPQAGGQSRQAQPDYVSNGRGGSYDNSRNDQRANSFDDEDDDRGFRSDNRQRSQQGQPNQAASNPRQQDDDADYGAWHAYGHSRGYHAYQRRDGLAGGGTYGNADQGRYSDRGQGALAGNQGRPGNQRTTQGPSGNRDDQNNRNRRTQVYNQNRDYDDDQ